MNNAGGAKIAEHSKAIDVKREKEDQKHSPDKREARPTSDKFITWDQGLLSLTETPFDPRMDEHAVFLAAAPPGQSAADYVLQLQRTYGNRYVQRLVQSMEVQAELPAGDSDNIYEPEADRIAEEVEGSSVSRIQNRAEREKADRQTDDLPGLLRRVEVERAAFTDILQRQGTAAPAVKEPETAELDAELDALLSEIDRLFPTPEIPPFEVITGTTTAGYSKGELEEQIQKSWQKEKITFTSAARLAARRNIAAAKGGPRATQSPEIKPSQPYSIRWSLNIFAADYRKGGKDLPEIKKLLKSGSPFQKSLAAEFSKVIPVKDPTADEINAKITDAIFDLSKNLGTGQIGELVVTFSGHGGAGRVTGVDGKQVKREDFRSLAQIGEDLGVHLVFILDTCRAGALVSLAQEEALEEVSEKITKLPTEEQKSVQLLVDFAKEVSRLKWEVCRYTYDVGNAERRYRRKRNKKRFRDLFQAIVGLSKSIQDLSRYLKGSEIPEGILSSAAISDAIGDAALYALFAMGGGRKDVRSLLRKTAVLLDVTNDFMNELISQLNTKVSAGSAAP